MADHRLVAPKDGEDCDRGVLIAVRFGKEKLGSE